MEEWKEYRLGDVCSRLRSGKSIKSDSVYTTGKYPVIGGNGVRGYTDEPNFKGECAVIGRQGAYCGNVRFYEGEAYMTEHAVLAVGNNLADTYYLSCLLSLMHLGNLSAQSAQPGISVQTLSKQIITLPIIEYQKRVSSILKSLDDKIEVNRRINENLEAQAQALFKSWFVDFEPFRDGEFVESELGMIPKGWRVQEVKDVFEINIGKTPPRKEPEWFSESNENNIWVSIADMGNCGVFISDSNEYLTDKAVKRFNVQLVEKDSVLLSFKLTVGRVAIADARLTTNEAIARFILPQKCYREFLYLYLKQYKYENLGSTSSIATAVNSKTIKGMKLIFPSFDILMNFSNNTKPLFEQIRIMQQESRRLATLRDTLLPRLMSGEIKVKEIENEQDIYSVL